jgi:hypothetical protein
MHEGGTWQYESRWPSPARRPGGFEAGDLAAAVTSATNFQFPLAVVTEGHCCMPYILIWLLYCVLIDAIVWLQAGGLATTNAPRNSRKGSWNQTGREGMRGEHLRRAAISGQKRHELLVFLAGLRLAF